MLAESVRLILFPQNGTFSSYLEKHFLAYVLFFNFFVFFIIPLILKSDMF